MNIKRLKRISEFQWRLEKTGRMRVPGIIFAGKELIEGMDDKVLDQVSNVACLPGIVNASYAMPDAHWGYGFCIGGVAAFDPDKSGIISAGGVGFDIACGVRTLHTGLKSRDIERIKETLAETLFRKIPAGVGSTGRIHLKQKALAEALTAGARWAVEYGYGRKDDLRFTEENGCVAGANPADVSDHARKRQQDQVGTLGSGNHYLEVQKVVEVYDDRIAKAFGIEKDDIKISIHCGSRGLGHQIGTDYLKSMVTAAKSYGLELTDRELACAPLNSAIGQSYLGAMRCGINCAMANRQVLTHLVREVFETLEPKADIRLLYDVSHNTCKLEEHSVNNKRKKLFVHRKGATRAFGPGDKSLPAEYAKAGQPVLIGGTMGTASYILAGTSQSEELAFGSACHGAGSNMSRRAATKKWPGKDVVRQLAASWVLIKSRSMRGIAEEAPLAYKNVDEVIEATHAAKLAKKVAKLVPLICVKG